MKHQSSQFEEILIPPIILAGLYSNTIVVIDDKQTNASPSKKVSPAVHSLPTAPAPGNEVLDIPDPSKIIPTGQPINWLGDFLQQVTILVDEETDVFLGDGELELLSKMLQAVKLSLADIALVNTARQAVSWPELVKKLPAKTVIFFGVEPSSIGVPMRFPHFRVQHWDNTSFLYSPSLTTINTASAEQNTLKMALWKALQEIFTKR